MKKALISTCSLGIPCQYHGSRAYKREKYLASLLEKFILIPVCPEQLGGLPTPRPACKIIDGRVIGKDKNDYTENYLRGARYTLYIAKTLDVNEAFLKKGSPSCGQNGITRHLLEENGIKVHII